MKHFGLNLLLILLLSILCPRQGWGQTREYQLIHQGNMKFLAKDYNAAGAHYRQALKRNPGNARAIFNLADTYLAQNNPSQADSLYQQVTQLENNKTIKAMAWHNRGFIQQTQALHDQQNQQKLLREAIAHYKEALRLNPRDNDTRYNLALCQHQLKESEQQNQNPDNQQDENNQQKKEQKQQNDQKDPAEQEDSPKEKQNNQPYLNLIKQTEKETLKKLNRQNPVQKTLDKNW